MVGYRPDGRTRRHDRDRGWAPAEMARNRVATAPLRRFAGMVRVVDELDLLVISGGGRTRRPLGWAQPQPLRLLMWVAAARWSHVPIAVIGAGVDGLGPARHQVRRVAMRSHTSRSTIRARSTSFAKRGSRPPAWSVRSTVGLLPGITSTSWAPPTTAPRIVISPISREAWGDDEEAVRYDEYVDSLVLAARQLAGEGAEIVIVCSQPRMDGPIADTIVRSVGSLADVQSPDDFVAMASSASVVIAARLHALILAMVAGAPVVTIAPGRKQHQLMADAELTEFVLQLDGLTPAPIVARAHDAMARQDELRAHVRAWVSASRSSLDATYDQLVEAVRVPLTSRGAHCAPEPR